MAKTRSGLDGHREPAFSNADHRLMDEFIAFLFDKVQEGDLTKESAVGFIAHLIAMADIGNPSHAAYMKAVMDGEWRDA